ncbi:MAG: Rpn family recombination-promoting nuclease/putative transposase [Thermodesulfobium sp.]
MDTRTFIGRFFPKDIRKHIDLDSVKLIDNKKLTKGYKKYQLDLSFDCKFKGKESKFYLIFEHKSGLDKFVLLQILSYMVVTWETNLKQNKDLIPIIPIIFYQGKEKWNMSDEFSDQFKSIKSDL